MRIVIEGDKGGVIQPDRGPAVEANVIDAGPPPAALLRQFGREAAQDEGGAALKAKAPLNPLRAGEAVARARYGPKAERSATKASAERTAPKRSPLKASARKRKK